MNKFLVVCATLLLARSAQATVAIELGGPELAALSDLIVHARVVKVGGHVQTHPVRVFTDAELEVIENIKGASAGEHLLVSYPGGVHNGMGMFVSGQVALQEQSECVIYLRRSSSGGFIPTAMRQGFFTVQKRDYDGVRIGVKNTSGLALVHRGAGIQKVNETPQQWARPLITVIADIRKDLPLAEKIDRAQLMGAK